MKRGTLPHHRSLGSLSSWIRVTLSSVNSAIGFYCFIPICCIILYANSLFGTFIWDDRAAVIANSDVHGITPLSDIFFHDFWGADISSPYSHKSYRPLTVLTFRMDYWLYGFNATGYHITNVLVYTLCCIIVYTVFQQWMSNPIGAKIATSLFIVHPVHVEAVASVVGRADALCGLLYSAALLCYAESAVINSVLAYAPKATVSLHVSILWTIAAYLLAFAASFSKEIGVTVFAMFMAMDVFQHLKIEQRLLQATKSNSKNQPINGILQGLLKILKGLAHNVMKSSSSMGIIRLLLANMSLLVIFYIRRQLHGQQQMYQWTIMENHVHHLDSFSDRVLSYAQYHFWYLFKLLYPQYLCFDYGYDCIPVVNHVLDWHNILPLMAYTSLLLLLIVALRHMRLSLLFGIVLLIVPLLPALNIFVAVGTLLAERLLFIPSMGFCLLIGELVSVDLAGIGQKISVIVIERMNQLMIMIKEISALSKRSVSQQNMKATPLKNITIQTKHVSFSKAKKINYGKGKQNKRKGNESMASQTGTTGVGTNSSPLKSALKRSSSTDSLNDDKDEKGNENSKPTNDVSLDKAISNGFNLLHHVLIPIILILLSVRVVQRNNEWGSEYDLFSSGLSVCPRSLKVLSNHALLSISREEYPEALTSALSAVDVYPEQVAALINAGIAYQRLRQFSESIEYLKRALAADPNNSKAAGYLGHSYQLWARQQQYPNTQHALRIEALKWLERAISMGFDEPLMLFVTGTTLMDLNRLPEAVIHYETAISRSLEKQSFLKNSSSVLKEDDINIAYAFNQIGTAYWSMQQVPEAIKAFEEGLKYEPDSVEILTNCGNLYREAGDISNARRLMEKAIITSGDAVPIALVNNLGLLELQVGNYSRAIELFEKALKMHLDEVAAATEVKMESVTSNGNSIADVIRMNIQRASQAMTRAITPDLLKQ